MCEVASKLNVWLLRSYNLSASDVRCLQPEHFGILGLPVAELLALLHGRALARRSRSTFNSPAL